MPRAIFSGLVVLLLLAPAPARASSIFVSFDVQIAMQPEGPPTFEPFTGAMSFFQTFCSLDSDTCFSNDLGGLAIPSLAFGDDVFVPPNPTLPPNPIVPNAFILMTLAGLAGTSDAFGYPPDPIAPEVPPISPPVIALGSFPLDALVGSQVLASGPIYAFASPGTLIGTWQVTATVVQPVPEPTTLTLLGIGLAGIGSAARRRRQGAT